MSIDVKTEKFITIHIEWHGPFCVEEVLKGDKQIFNQIGLYQIYGNHLINGVDNLLYIGHSIKGFSERFRDHYNTWIKHECSDLSIYLGVIWENEKIEQDLQTLFIRESEKLLIYYCSPPYNSALVYDLTPNKQFVDENIMVINLWKKHRLPYEVSTLWYNSECWNSKRALLNLSNESEYANRGI